MVAALDVGDDENMRDALVVMDGVDELTDPVVVEEHRVGLADCIAGPAMEDRPLQPPRSYWIGAISSKAGSADTTEDPR